MYFFDHIQDAGQISVLNPMQSSPQPPPEEA